MLRALVVLIILGLVVAWWLGYVPAYRPTYVPAGSAATATSPATPTDRGPIEDGRGSMDTNRGPVDPAAARERGARLGEQTADAANRVARAVDDGAITAKITSKMALDDTVRARDVHVHTQAGLVTLTGTVASQAERQKAVQLARDTDGVQSVVDRLEVRQ